MKRSLLIEADGGPLSVIVVGANVHDTGLLAATLEAIVVERPEPTEEEPQHLCLDKGYDTPTGREAVAAQHSVPHIRRSGQEKINAQGGEALPSPALGGRTHTRVVKYMPGHPGAL